MQAVLAARIDRLPEREKRLLQQASVIGKTFSERVLMRICGLGDADLQEAIRALRDAEFLYEESLYPHVEYAFKHPLTQEVADRSQLKERRAETHAAVARAIEELSGDRLDEEAALIAHHWEEAGEDLAAARWHARAARWIGLSNYTEAFAHWRRVVALIGDTEDSSDAIRLRIEARRTILMLGFRIGISEDEAAAIFAAGRRDAQRLGDDASLALLMVTYAALRQNAGAIDDYLALACEADRIAARSGDRAAYAAVGPDHFYSLYAKGRLAESWSVAQEVRERSGGDVSLGHPAGRLQLLRLQLHHSGWPLIEMGRMREAEACLRRGLELAQGARPRGIAQLGLTTVQVFLADAKGDRGPGAMNWARLAAEAAERAGSHQARAMAHLCSVDRRCSRRAVGHGHRARREGDRDLAHGLRRRLRCCRCSRRTRVRSSAPGGASEPATCPRKPSRVAKRQGQPVHQCEATIAHVRCLRGLEGADARQTIETLLEEVSQLIEQTGAERWRPHVHVERAELYRLTGDTDAARRELAEAHRLFAEMGATGHARAHRAAAGGAGAMNLLDVVREVRRHLEENGRLSLRMLRRQFELDDDALEEVIGELVDVQRVARREENALAWSARDSSGRHPSRLHATRAPIRPSTSPRRSSPHAARSRASGSRSPCSSPT